MYWKINGRCFEQVTFIDEDDYDPDCEAWLIAIPWSNCCTHVGVVNATCGSDAIDKLADSKYKHWIVIDDPDDVIEAEDGGWCSYCGNECVPCNLQNITVLERVKTIEKVEE
jgi:hypothetical protein